MTGPIPTRCWNCDMLAAETVCHVCKEPRDAEPEEHRVHHDDERLDDPRHGQARSINRENRGRQ